MRNTYTYSVLPFHAFTVYKFNKLLQKSASEMLTGELEGLASKMPFPFTLPMKGSSFYLAAGYLHLHDLKIGIDNCMLDLKREDFLAFVDRQYPEKATETKGIIETMEWLVSFAEKKRMVFNNKTELIVEFPWISKYWNTKLVVSDARGYVKRIPKEDSDRLYELLQAAIFVDGGGTYEYSPKGTGTFFKRSK